MDHGGSRPMGPVGDVLFELFLSELLEKILDYCSHSDQKQLLNCRLVCSFWRDCAFSVFASNLSIVPGLNLENPKRLDWSVEPVYKKFCEMVKPQSLLPVNAFLRYSRCEMPPIKFFQDYSSNMVSIVAHNIELGLALLVTQFPQLRKLVVDSALGDYDSDPPPQPNNLMDSTREYLKTKGHRLVELILNLDYYHIELGEMPNLKALKLGPTTSVSGTEPNLPKLLPNLKHISFGLSGNLKLGATSIQQLTSNGAVFSNVAYVEVHLNMDVTNEESELIVGGLVNCFPNTKKLLWGCRMSSLQFTSAIQMVFSSLKYLTSLRIIVLRCITSEEILRLLTNLSVEEIPEDEENWDDALVDGTKTLRNLKFLRTLILELCDNYDPLDSPLELPELESRFLLKGVFMKMDNLRKISFGHITYNPECIQAWRDSGRQFETITHRIEEDNCIYRSHLPNLRY